MMMRTSLQRKKIRARNTDYDMFVSVGVSGGVGTTTPPVVLFEVMFEGIVGGVGTVVGDAMGVGDVQPGIPAISTMTPITNNLRILPFI